MNDPQLIFVYNANGSLFSRLTDFAHKIVSPSTYACTLCALTYGNFTVKEEWRSFIESLPLETVFMYRDQFELKYGHQGDLPAVYLSTNQSVREVISRKEINYCKNLRQLKELVQANMEGQGL
ncbi:hypothetical protein GZH53_06755 [Flavihumibacter sp. R14]|nr:hypothetical protein [Flavihumibacter soli]